MGQEQQPEVLSGKELNRSDYHMTKECLESYEFVCKEIDILSRELLELRSDQLIKKQGLTEKLYLGKVINKTLDELTEEIIIIEDKIKKNLHELLQKRVEIEDYINNINDCEMRLILRLRYIERMTYDEIASRITVICITRDGLQNVKGTGISEKISRFFKKQKIE
jgi:hypothetical protein